MRILLIKLTSLGDIVHALPALSDALAAIPDLRVDWVIEESYAEMVSQHPAVENVIPVPYRTIRKQGLGGLPMAISQWRKLRRQLRGETYDCVIDAQGLLKSANLVFINKAPTFGFNFQSAREPLAAALYKNRIQVSKNQHAIERQRQLFAKALNYARNDNPARYSLEARKWKSEASEFLQQHELPSDYLMFLHGSAWTTKTWPESRWRQLAEEFNERTVDVLIPWGSNDEHDRAQRLSKNLAHVHVLPKLSIVEVGKIIANARAVAGVDSGLGHIAAAFDVPGLVLIGPTDPELIGHYGKLQRMIVSTFPLAPCYRRQCKEADNEKCCMAAINVDQVSRELHDMLANHDRNQLSTSGRNVK